MLTLRPVRPEDHAWCRRVKDDGLRAYAEFWIVWDEAEQAARFAARFQPEHTRIVVRAGRDIGWLAWRGEPEVMYLDQLYVVEAERGRGTGTALLRGGLREAGDRPVELMVLKNNPALRLYHRHGFRVVGDLDHKWVVRRVSGPEPIEPVSVTLGDEAQRALCEALPVGVRGEGQRAVVQGVANHTWIYDQHVVRIARGTAVSGEDARTEAVAVPAVVKAGIGTPPLVNVN